MGACSSKPKTREGAIEPSRKIPTENQPPETLKSESSVIDEGEGATASHGEIPEEKRELSAVFMEKERLAEEVKLGEENVKEEASEKGEEKVSSKDDASLAEAVNLDKGSGGVVLTEGLASDAVEEKGNAYTEEAGLASKDQAMEVSEVPRNDLDASGLHADSPVVHDDRSVEPADAGAVSFDSSKAMENDDVPSAEPSDVTALPDGVSVAAEMNDVPCEEPAEGSTVPEATERDDCPSAELTNVSTVPEVACTASETDDSPSPVGTDVGASSSVAPVMVMETTATLSGIQGLIVAEDGIPVKEVEGEDGIPSESVALVPQGNNNTVKWEDSAVEVPRDVKVDEAEGESAGEYTDPAPAAADTSVKESGIRADPHVEKAVEESTGEGIDKLGDEAIPSENGQPQEGKAEIIGDEANGGGKPETTPREGEAEDSTKSESVQAHVSRVAPEQLNAMSGEGEPIFKDASDVPMAQDASTQ